jgi:hypothetical protein
MDMYICHLSMLRFETYLWISFESLSPLVLIQNMLVHGYVHLVHGYVHLSLEYAAF